MVFFQKKQIFFKQNMDAEHITLIRKNRSILSDEYSSNSDTEDNDDDEPYNKSSSSPPRTKKRITRIAIFGIVLIFLVLVYIPLSSNVQSRIGKSSINYL